MAARRKSLAAAHCRQRHIRARAARCCFNRAIWSARPTLRIGHGEPRVDVVFGRKDMSVAHRRIGRHRHVERQLQHRYDRVPPEFRRDVRTAWRIHPFGATIEIAIIEKRNRIARILQVDDAHGPQGASAGPGSPFWFMKRTNEPSRNCGNQAGEPGLRCSVMLRQILLSKGGPLHSAPWMGSPSISKSSTDFSEFIAPRLRPCR